MVENIGNATPYAGASGHRPLPRADETSYRAPHQEQPAKSTSTFDWDWNKATCSSCQTKVTKSDLVDGVCGTCRGEKPANDIPAPVVRRKREHSSGGDQVYVPYDDTELAERFQAPTSAPPVDPDPKLEPDLAPAAELPPHDGTRLGRALAELEAEDPQVAAAAQQLDHVIEQITRPDVHVRPENLAADPAPDTAALTATDLLQMQLDHTTATLTRAHKVRDPMVGILRSAALSAIAALDLYIEFHHPLPSLPSSGLGRDQPAADPEGEAGRQPATSPRGRPRRITDPDVLADVVRRYVDDRQTTYEISDALDISRATASRILRDAGVVMRPPAAGAHAEVTDDLRARIVDTYLSGRSLAATGRAFHVAADTVHDLVVAAGHAPRPKGGRHAADAIARRLDALGATHHTVKTWAVQQGLIPEIPRGLVQARLVDAYAAAHPTQPEPGQTGDTA